MNCKVKPNNDPAARGVVYFSYGYGHRADLEYLLNLVLNMRQD